MNTLRKALRASWPALAGACTIVVVPSCLAAAAAGATTAASYDLEIPSQDLHAALQQLALVSHYRLFYKSEVVAGKTSPAISGSYTAEQALRQLLIGSDLIYEITPESVVLIRPREATVSGEPSSGGSPGWIRVASADMSSESEKGEKKETTHLPADLSAPEVVVSGRRIDSVTMMKRGETLRDTPQAVTIITQQRIDEQKLVTVSEVLEQAPGLTVVPDFFGRPNTYLSRGFEITNIQIDGASVDVGRSYYFNPNLAMYEQVEVLRGADGLFAGNGDPSGTVNLARKRAKANAQVLVDASVGSWNNYNAQLDVTGPLAFDGRLRGRAVASWHDKEFFYDTADDRGTFFYGTIEGDITPDTVLIVGGSYEESDQTPWQAGLPRSKTGSSLGVSRDTALMADWSTWEQDAQEAFVRFEHRFNSNWLLAASASYGQSKVHTLSGAVYGYELIPGGLYYSSPGLTPGSTLGLPVGTGYDYDSERTVYDISLQGKFELFGREHSVLLGADKASNDNISMPMSVTWNGLQYSSPVDITNFDPSSIPYPTLIYRSYWGNNMTRQHGFYGKLQLQLLEPLRLIVGGRYFDYKYRRPFDNYNAAGAVIGSGGIGYEDTGIFNPYYGVLYNITPRWTLYGSVTEIYRSQASSLAGPSPGSPLDPMTGRNYEVGTKAELRDGRANVSLALYRTERNGQAEQDLRYPPVLGGDYSGNCCYLALGKVLSEGVDAEVSGEVLPGWSLSAGYTYNKNENRRSGAIFQALAPKHLFKLWTTYRVPALQDRLLIGGGVTAQSARYVAGTLRSYNTASGLFDGPTTPFEYSQGGYAVVSAMAQYQFSDMWSLSFNANNLLDKTYYTGLGQLTNNNYYGQPRNYVFGVRAKF